MAPLPPYERPWRHPAERAAQERDEFERVAAPPPLSRRARTYVGTFGLLVCAAILSVALPKGVSDDATGTTDTTVPAPSSSSMVPIKGFVTNPALVVAGSHGVTSALPVGEGHLLTALEEVTGRGDVWVTLPTGEDVAAGIVATDAESGLALLRVGPDDRTRLPRSMFRFADARTVTVVPFDATVLDEARLIDSDGDQRATIDDGVTTSPDNRYPIVSTPRAIAGVAAVVGPGNRPIGIAVRAAQTTRVVPLDHLWKVLSTVFGLSGTDD